MKGAGLQVVKAVILSTTHIILTMSMSLSTMVRNPERLIKIHAVSSGFNVSPFQMRNVMVIQRRTVAQSAAVLARASLVLPLALYPATICGPVAAGAISWV